MGNASIRNLAGPAIASLRYWCNERRKPDLRCGCSTELDVLVGTRQVRKKKKRSIRRQHEKKKKKTKNGNRIVTNANWGLVQRKRKQQKKGKTRKARAGTNKKKKERKELQIQCVELPRGKTFPVPNSLDTPLSKHTP